MTDTRARLTALFSMYPRMEAQDVFKYLHQSVFGCGHFVHDRARGIAWIEEEMKTAQPDGHGIVFLDGDFVRVPVGYKGLGAEALFERFFLSSSMPCGTVKDLEKRLCVLRALAQSGEIPLSSEMLNEALQAWQAAGYPSLHHSETYRRLYHPAYRVVHRSFISDM